MKKQVKKIPSLTFNSDYFCCPKCGWTYPGPMLVKGNSAPSTRCQNCGHLGLIRK